MSERSPGVRAHKGRGAVSARDGRFVKQQVQLDDAEASQASAATPETVLTAMRAGKIISHNNSPDIPFDRSINPYQGCEHVISSYELFTYSTSLSQIESAIESIPNNSSCWAKIASQRPPPICGPSRLANTNLL